MISTIITCDKCGKQIEGQEHFFYVTVRRKYKKDEGLIFTEDQYDMTLCGKCAETVTHQEAEKEADEEPEDSEPVEAPEKKPVAKKKAAAVPTEQKKAAVKKEESKAAVREEKPGEEKEKKAAVQNKKIDPIMVKVLLNKGWTQMRIADELGITQAAVSKAIKRLKEKEL